MTDFPRRHPLLLYFVLACALFWGCIAVGFIDRFDFWVPILAGCGKTDDEGHVPLSNASHQWSWGP